MPFVGYNDPSDSPTVTINGTDYTAFLAGGNAFDVQQTLPTIPRDDERRAKFEPILAIGSINLFADQEILVIDWEAAISNDLKEGRPIIITTQHNTYRLRVRNWDVTDQDPCTGTIRSIQINVTDLLGLINRDTKRPGVQAYQTLLSGEGLSSANPVILWQNAVRLIGQFPRKANDQPYLIAADFDLPSGNFTENGFLDTETVPTGTFNAAEAIASILYARGYACWCDPADERIKVAPIPLDVSAETPVYRWDCRQLQAFTVSRGTEEPVDRVEATVQSVKTRFRVIRNGVSIADDLPPDTLATDVVDTNAVAVEVWPKTYPININGDDIRATRTEQQPAITESTASYSYSESGKLSALFPGNPSDTTINYLTGTLERKSHPIYRFAVSEIRTERVAKGVLSDTVFPEVQDKADRRLVRRWKVSNLGDGGDGILTHEYEQLWLPRSVVLEDDQESDTLTISYEEGRRYQEYSPGQWVSVPYRLIADIDNLSTDLISDPDFTGQTEFVDGVPAPPTHPETDPEEIEVNTAEANAESNGDSSGASLRARLTYGNRRSLARTTADVSLALSQWNRIVYNLARPEQAADTWQPFLREDAAKSALVRVGHVLQAGEGIVLFGYTGLKAATLAKPITIEDTDAGQLPSETAIAPVYTAIERSVVNDDFPAMSEEISIIELASASVNDDFPVMTEQIIVSEIETAEISDDFPAMSEEISIGEAASASVSDDFPAMTEEVSIVEVVFTPADISPVFWFDADDASTITESGGVISQVNDKSGNANHASQSSSGSRPTVVASAQNGMAGISFDGSNDFLEFDNPAGVRANNAKTIYALWVGQSGVGLYDFTIATRYLSSTDLSRGYIARAESSVGLAYDHTGNGQARAGTYTDGSTAFARWTTGANGATPGFELNGTVLTLAANTLGTALTETSPDRTTIGQQGGGYGGFYLLELVGVTGNPGTAVHDQMAGYFAHRWGLTANLPSGHPYKTTPP